MFKTLSTLIAGVNARTEDRVRDAFAIELIDQKIRDAETHLAAAKSTLVSLIQRQRSEARQMDTLTLRVTELTRSTHAAIKANEMALATEAAGAIAMMENETAIRATTLQRLDAQILRLRASIDAGNRRIIDLKQGAIQAHAVRREQDIQSRLTTSLGGPSAAQEAEDLIARVLGRDDPFEQGQILAEIDADLHKTNLADRMAERGFGLATKITAASVLARFSNPETC